MSILLWILLGLFNLMLFRLLLPLFSLGIGSSWDAMVFYSCIFPLNLTDLPRFCLMSDRASFFFVAAVRRTFWSIPLVLYTPLRSVRVHSTIIFHHWLANHSDGLHVFLVLASAALLGFVSLGGLSSLLFPAMTGMVRICPCGGFRGFYSFVDLFGNFHPLKYLTGLLVGFPFIVSFL